jgi:hypothetical protein
LKAATQTLDFTRPIALMLMGILGHIGDHDEARSIVKRLLDPYPPAATWRSTTGPTSSAKRLRRPSNATTKVARSPYHLGSPEQIAGFFDGLELVEPGLVSVPRWRPDPAAGGDLPAEVDAFGGVGRKP